MVGDLDINTNRWKTSYKKKARYGNCQQLNFTLFWSNPLYKISYFYPLQPALASKRKILSDFPILQQRHAG